MGGRGANGDGAPTARILPIRQLTTGELREQRHLQGNHSNRQLATDDLQLANPLKTDVYGKKKMCHQRCHNLSTRGKF